MVLVRYSFFKNIHLAKTLGSGSTPWNQNLVFVPVPKIRPSFSLVPTIQNWRFLVLTPQRRYLPNIDLNLLFEKGYAGEFPLTFGEFGSHNGSGSELS
jgi:hypothetical protein